MNKDCTQCRFSDVMPLDKNNIGLPRQRFCRLNPPQIIIMPTPQGIAQQCAFPMVDKSVYCHQFQPLDN